MSCLSYACGLTAFRPKAEAEVEAEVKAATIRRQQIEMALLPPIALDSTTELLPICGCLNSRSSLI